MREVDIMIRNCKLIFLLIFFVCIFTSQTVIAEENSPIVAFTHWPPWKVVKGNSFDGIDYYILKELGKRLNLHFQFIECPWIRCLERIKSGQVDFINGIAKQADREKYMYFIEPPYKEIFSTAFYKRKGRKGSPHLIQKYEDLYKVEIGMIRGSVYFERFDKDSKITKVEVTNEIQLLQMLYEGRFDIILGNDLNIDYLIQINGFMGRIEKAPFKVDSYTPTYIAISKKSKFKGIIPQVSAALKEMVESNKIREIEQTYLNKFKLTK